MFETRENVCIGCHRQAALASGPGKSSNLLRGLDVSENHLNLYWWHVRFVCSGTKLASQGLVCIVHMRLRQFLSLMKQPVGIPSGQRGGSCMEWLRNHQGSWRRNCWPFILDILFAQGPSLAGQIYRWPTHPLPMQSWLTMVHVATRIIGW